MRFFLEKKHEISVAAPVIASSSISEVLCNAVPWQVAPANGVLAEGIHFHRHQSPTPSQRFPKIGVHHII